MRRDWRLVSAWSSIHSSPARARTLPAPSRERGAAARHEAHRPTGYARSAPRKMAPRVREVASAQVSGLKSALLLMLGGVAGSESLLSGLWHARGFDVAAADGSGDAGGRGGRSSSGG